MTTTARATLGAALLLFLVVGDAALPLGLPWSSWWRLPVLAVAVIASLALCVRRPACMAPLAHPPMVFFLAFCALALVSAAHADAPRVALRYAFGYVVVAGVAATAATSFSPGTLLRGLLVSLLLKLAVSLGVANSPFAWWEGIRFQGALGNPNPMGAAAGLAYLLLMLHGWYHWPSRAARWALIAGGIAATTVLACTRSVSAMGATLAAVSIAAPTCALRTARWRDRLGWLAVAAALLVTLQVASPGQRVADANRLAPPERALELRVRWWETLGHAVMKHPWGGYGAGSTASLALDRRPPWGTSAHNLYLEAGIFAGIPAAVAMLLFVASALAAAARRAWITTDDARAGVLAVIAFYAVLSLVEPVILNGAPSSLVVPLVAAAACSREIREGRESRS